MYIVHTSNFFNFGESDNLLAGKTDRYELFKRCITTIPENFNSVPFTVVFIDFGILKIGCVNYVRFSNPVTYLHKCTLYIYIYIYIYMN